MKRLYIFVFLFIFSFISFAQRSQNTVQVRVNTNPSGAYFTIGQSKYGPTPTTVPMIINQYYELTFTMPGYQTQTITYKAGTGDINVNLIPLAYSLNITSSIAGADVYINGQLYGKTPLTLTLNGGNYSITIKMSGYKDWATNVNLSGNQNINATLIPDTYTLTIGANITGADVYINGQLYGKTPLNVSLSPGAYNILVKLDGYKDWATSINLTSNQNISANLEMLRFIILSLPVGAKLWLNGKPYHLDWGNIKDEDSDDRNIKRDKYKDFKIFAETNNKTETIEIKYRHTSTGPMNVEFNNKAKELRLMLVDK